MPRPPSPPELSPLERTALWVQAQAAQSYARDPQPPSPARSSTTTKTTSSYRTTASSDAVSLKPTSLVRSSSMQHQTPSTRSARPPSASATHRPRYDSRARRSSLPFPQSPPGSGYPVQLEVAAPRRPESEEPKASITPPPVRRLQADASSRPQAQTPRPSLRKQRRPSLIEQIIIFGTPGTRRKEEPGGSRRKT